MDSSRKEVIINEIIYWKNHKMLPDHYCDYLLALYSEGELNNEISDVNKRKHGGKFGIFLFILCLIVSVSLFVIYFTELAFILQTMILTSFVVFLLILGFYYSNKEFWYSIFYIGAAFLFLLLSIHIIEKLFNNNSLALYITLFFNCFIWLLTGWRMKLLYFIISGVLGILVLIIYLNITG
ncbi:hypothetical protein MXL46_02965 [Heyndrickxia sporothermodurans]|uniref:DUF2157 domain-containing protein n=1 Tax=Heyndrickxia sporothermodurans TaxID=46224 RepID=A0A150LH65_9BACI|nr:hypothetical protein [Heyndrickxia sporothermodurans]KYD11580.1 hypothetical protein B4102_1483 [Heyndrickxia sporothermodurans]MBL5766086.1 hypothetical protein [Heyndrickxia sporothermodurans]MBL5769527.1 hypothetical protein [Heyndrickxia sporothermodurans]MBL5773308.1 hypothetical protein [Heyndrickxia sporothermodurans]MBL5778501.1 hypothetical protein [Heyndrickxia sporothermodurans]